MSEHKASLTDEERDLLSAYRAGGRDGVLRALGMEQVECYLASANGNACADDLWTARVAVPEPSEGHACEDCGTTVEACDQTIRELTMGCCAGCQVRDTHGLLAVPEPSKGEK